MSRQQRYTAEQVRAIIEIMRAAPPIEKREEGLRKSDVIKALKGEILALQKRGYSLPQIAELIRRGGVDISTATLKSYIQRSKSSTSSKKATKAAPTIAAKATTAEEATAETKSSFEIRPDTDDL